MEHLFPSITIFFLIVSVLYGFYYGLFFKKMIYYAVHKPKSKVLFWLKFFLPNESIGMYYNVHSSRNKRLFSKGWLILSFIYFFGFIFGTPALLLENAQRTQELVIQPIQKQNLQYVSARLITEKNGSNKAHVFIITKDKKKYKFNDYIYKKKNPNPSTYLQLLRNNEQIKVAYMSFPYMGFFKTDKLLSLKTKDDKEIIKFAEVKKEILTRDVWLYSKNTYHIGILLLLFTVVTLPIRYHLYGFDGVDKLIKVKHKELKKYGKFIHQNERYMSEEEIQSGRHRGEVEIKKENKKWL